MNHFFWLDEIIVIAIHEDQLAQHGGLTGVRDHNLFLASYAKVVGFNRL